MNHELFLSVCLFLLGLGLTAPISFASTECSRDWASGKISEKRFKIIGLGVSSRLDPKTANEEARAAAFKDISLQLQSSVQSKSEIKESQAESSYQGNSILTSNIEDLVGLKAVKSGQNPEEKITRCEVYEFNIQSAYENQASKLSIVQEKIDQVTDFAIQKKWIDVIREFPLVKPLANEYKAVIVRADLFKSYVGLPGPGWNERFEKALTQLESLDQTARSNLIFIFPKDPSKNSPKDFQINLNGEFEAAITEISGWITRSGAQAIRLGDPESPGALRIEISIRNIGGPVKSKTKLGLTVTRKIAISLTDLKTKRTLSSNRGLSIVGTSSEGDYDEAMSHSENQMIGAIADAVRNAVPHLMAN